MPMRFVPAVAWFMLVCVYAGAGDSPPALSLPDTTPPGKPHFDTRGAKVGDQLPNLPMQTLEGKLTSLGTSWADGPTLLLTSSYTCPKSRATFPQAKDLAARVAARGVHVALIYIIEAHPAGDPSPYSGKEDVTAENRRDKILCRQPTTLAERLALANQFSRGLRCDMPVLVDEMDNAAWHQLGGGPNMGVLVDQDGIVLARQGWFDAPSISAAIDTLTRAAAPAASPQKRDPAEERIDDTLTELIREDKREALRTLLDQQPQLANRVLVSLGGRTLLGTAASFKRLGLCELLLQRGADVNRQTPDEATPLHASARSGDVAVARFLIAHGADPNARAHGHGPTPLQEALFEKKLDLAAELVQSGARPNVYTAAATGDTDLLRRAFLDDPTSLLRPDGAGRSPLVYAAQAGRLDSVKLLLSLGVHDLPADTETREAAWWAARNRDATMLRLLLDAQSDPNLFDVAIDAEAPFDWVRSLLDHKADPNHLDSRGLRPLHLAAYANRADVLKLLLDGGANINATTTSESMLFCGIKFQKGDTPLHVAAENSQPASILFLVQHGAAVNLQNADGATPLFYAAGNPPDLAEPMVRCLIEHGADVNLAEREGQTPFDRANAAAQPDELFKSEGKRPVKVIELLKVHGAKPGTPPTP